MKAKIGVGAEIDFLTKGEMEQVLADHRREMAKMLRAAPIPKTVSNEAATDATGAAVIDLGVPGLGRTWNVRRVSATFQDATAALAAGVANIFRGSDPFNPLNFVERIPNGTQLPAFDKFSTDQFVLTQDEHLFVRITGAAATTAVFASAQVVDGIKGIVYDIDEDEAPKLSSVV